MKKYRISTHNEYKIEEIEVKGETEKFLITDNGRIAKHCTWYSHFDTLSEAVKYKYNDINSKILKLQKQIDTQEKYLSDFLLTYGHLL